MKKEAILERLSQLCNYRYWWDRHKEKKEEDAKLKTQAKIKEKQNAH